MTLEHISLLSNLEKVASGLRFRLASAAIGGAAACSYEPWQEVQRSAEVDAACLRVAGELAAPGNQQCNVAFRVELDLAELVRWRLRDAQRHLRESVPASTTRSVPRRDLRQLLVEDWHSYAEPYWLERREQAEVCSAGAGAC